MKTNICIFSTDSKKEIAVSAYSKDSATAYIFAHDLQEARAMLDDAETMAAEAAKNWEPEPEPEPVDPVEQERETRQTKRVFDSILKAHKFTDKHDTTGGLSLREMRVLLNQDRFDALSDTYVLAYRRGYNAAKKAAKKQAEERTHR